VPRLGSTAARLKLKGIDGGPHKRRSMWLNSTQREEPYQGLTYAGCVWRQAFSLSRCTGGAWLSSARVVRCWVKSRNERNPCPVLPARSFWGGGDSRETAGVNSEEGGDDVKSSCPLCLGLHTCYNGWYNEWRCREVERISKSRSQFGLGSATRPHEVGVASNRRSAVLR
jgi:hypothetical protein